MLVAALLVDYLLMFVVAVLCHFDVPNAPLLWLPACLALFPIWIAVQIVSGIGFLGAGIIIVRRGSVHGLTTAASVWESAAIGMAAGMGQEVLALITTVLAWVVVSAVPKLIGKTPAHQNRQGDEQGKE